MVKNSLIGLLVILLTYLLWDSRRQINFLKADHDRTLDSLHLQLSQFSPVKRQEILARVINPNQLLLGDSLVEAHSLSWTNSRIHHCLIQVRHDSTVLLEYKKADIKNPVTGQGQDTIYAHKTMYIPFAVYKDFRSKIAAVSFIDASRSNNYMCCFASGSMSWEANLADGNRYYHSSWCDQSHDMKAAFEVIFRVLNVREIDRWLGVK